MILGLDFDNTLVSYDEMFHRLAASLGLVDDSVEPTKRAVRDTLRSRPGGNQTWTELQGLVYGKLLGKAPATPGLETFLEACALRQFRVVIISHKTLVPAAGPPYDLHEAARAWLRDRGFEERFGVPRERWFFETTLAGKLARIASEGCTHFVDDLEELLTHTDFPEGVGRLHYVPAGGPETPGLVPCRSWKEVWDHLLGLPDPGR